MKELLNRLKWKIKVSVYNQNIFNLIALLRKRLPGAGSQERSRMKMLDIGCNEGIYTRTYCEEFGIDFENSYGVDYNEEGIKLLPRERFVCHDIDALKPLPFEDRSFDLVIMNQVLEHTKNISHIIAEINRVGKEESIFAVSVPNMAAFHSRLFLLAGKIPSSVQGLDAHVRGFTRRALEKYVEDYGFRFLDWTGGGVYPFGGSISGFLGRTFPGVSVFITLLFEKVRDFDASRLEVKRFHDTKL